jgi:hypothetical protein
MASKYISLYSGDFFYPRPVDEGKENEIIRSYTLSENTLLLIIGIRLLYSSTFDNAVANCYNYKLKTFKKQRYIIKAIVQRSFNDIHKAMYHIHIANSYFNTLSQAEVLYTDIIDRYNDGTIEFNLI